MRARVTIWTRDSVQLTTYTCLASEALQRGLADVDEEGAGAYATVAHLDGSACYRIPERDGVVQIPDPGLKLLDSATDKGCGGTDP